MFQVSSWHRFVHLSITALILGRCSGWNSDLWCLFVCQLWCQHLLHGRLLLLSLIFKCFSFLQRLPPTWLSSLTLGRVWYVFYRGQVLEQLYDRCWIKNYGHAERVNLNTVTRDWTTDFLSLYHIVKWVWLVLHQNERCIHLSLIRNDAALSSESFLLDLCIAFYEPFKHAYLCFVFFDSSCLVFNSTSLFK